MCMCICFYTYIYICIYIYVYTQVYIWDVQTWVGICMYTCLPSHTMCISYTELHTIDSKKEDMCELTGLFWHLAAVHSVAPYIDRVPTDGNPADGPSRGSCQELVDRGAEQVESKPSQLLVEQRSWS